MKKIAIILLLCMCSRFVFAVDFTESEIETIEKALADAEKANTELQIKLSLVSQNNKQILADAEISDYKIKKMQRAIEKENTKIFWEGFAVGTAAGLALAIICVLCLNNK